MVKGAMRGTSRGRPSARLTSTEKVSLMLWKPKVMGTEGDGWRVEVPAKTITRSRRKGSGNWVRSLSEGALRKRWEGTKEEE